MAEEKKVLLEVTGLKQYFNVGRKDEVKPLMTLVFIFLKAKPLD